VVGIGGRKSPTWQRGGWSVGFEQSQQQQKEGGGGKREGRSTTNKISMLKRGLRTDTKKEKEKSTTKGTQARKVY